MDYSINLTKQNTMKTNFLLVVFALAFLYHQGSFAQIVSEAIQGKPVSLYSKAVWDIQLKAKFNNPYFQEEVALDMEIISPSGKKLLLPCYYLRGASGKLSQWQARFAPQEVGRYSYQLVLKQAGQKNGSVKKGSFDVLASSKKGILHTGNDWTFKFDNGEYFRGIGENICWESRASDDSKFFKSLHEAPRFNYEYLLRSLASNGGNYYRTWMCSWNLPLEWKSGFNNVRYANSDEYFNRSAAQKLDRMLELSDSLGIYVMLTLDHPGSFLGADWAKSVYNKGNGGSAVSADDFFVNASSKLQYKNRLRYLVARWGCYSSLGAWEFFNEIDNLMYADKDKTIPAENIVAWHSEMSAYLKQIDPYHHLVTTSISHRDLPGLNSISSIDFNQKHIYKNNHAIPTALNEYSQNFKKPYIIGEFGYEWDWNKNFDDFPLEMDSDYKRGLWYGLFSPTPVLPMSWWWEFFDKRNTIAYLSNVKIISDEMMKAGKGEFKPLIVSATNKVHVQAVKCGSSHFVYAFNEGNAAVETTIELELDVKNINKVKLYHCETGKFSAFTQYELNGTKLKIKDISLSTQTDVVLVCF